MNYLTEIRRRSPHIFNIMNEVASNFTANGIIAVGASPSISNMPEEAEEAGARADAVILNLGTLSKERAKAMKIAGKSANQAGIPVLLDPIAIGATTFRTQVIYDLLDHVKFAAICANAGEVAVLAGALDKTVSPDSALDENDPTLAEKVAKKYDTIVISTGEVDVITNGKQTFLCQNGVPMLTNITASGCLLTAIIGSFVSVAENSLNACVTGISAYGIAAERAVKQAGGPGTFMISFLDELYALTDDQVKKMKRVEQLT